MLSSLSLEQQIIDDTACSSCHHHHQQQQQTPQSPRPTSSYPTLKSAWDIGTLCLYLVSTYVTNTYIRDRGQYETSQWDMVIKLCEVWFFLDTVMSLIAFYHDHHLVNGSTSATANRNQDVSFSSRWTVFFFWARVAAWFAVAVISFLPWELKTLLEIHKKRNPLHEAAIRTQGTIKALRHLKKWHVSAVRHVLRHTKCVGIRLVKIIEFVLFHSPKYATYYKHMKTVLVLRLFKLLQLCWQVQVSFRVLWYKEHVDVVRLSTENCSHVYSRSRADTVKVRLDRSLLSTSLSKLGSSLSMFVSWIRLPRTSFLYKQTLERTAL